jgi:hypothetical protein
LLVEFGLRQFVGWWWSVGVFVEVGGWVVVGGWVGGCVVVVLKATLDFSFGPNWNFVLVLEPS